MPNLSAVINEYLVAGRQVVDQLGENWEDHLGVQSEPLWVKDQNKKLGRLLDLMENLQAMPKDQQVQAIKEVRAEIEIDLDGMVG